MKSVTFTRRIASLTYDAVLMISVMIAASFPFIWLFGPPSATFELLWIYRLYLWLVGFAFTGICWHQKGQTLGMKAWKIKVVESPDNTLPTWHTALLRYSWATVSLMAFGVGYVIALFHPRSIALHDYFSRTRLVMVKST